MKVYNVTWRGVIQGDPMAVDTAVRLELSPSESEPQGEKTADMLARLMEVLTQMPRPVLTCEQVEYVLASRVKVTL